MPRIRSISSANDTITITDSSGTKVFNASTIPVAQNTIAKVETYLNTILPTLTDGSYQIQVHVISLNPLRVSIGTWNPNLVIPSNWWIRD